MITSRRASLGVLFLVAASCAPGVREATTVGPPAPGDANRLPPVPLVLGDLDIEVVYPGEGSTVAASDSTFIFGNVGRGDASLTINGAPVEVAPNGGWLAFLPVPADGVYQLSAAGGGQTAQLTRNVRAPNAGPPGAAPTALRIVPGSVTPSGTITAVRGEQVEVSFRGTPGGQARLVLPDGSVVPLVEQRAVDRRSGFMLESATAASNVAEYTGVFELGRPIAAPDTAVDAPSLGGLGYVEQRERQAGNAARVELTVGGQTVQANVPAAIGLLESSRPRVGVAATTRPDSTVIGRRLPGGDQAWDFFWPNGTLLIIDGERAGMYRVRLTPELSAWVAQGDVELLPEGTPEPSGWVGPSMEIEPHDRWVDIRFAMSDRLPFRIDPGEWGLAVEFYNAIGRPAYVGYGATDPFVDSVDWDQTTDDIYRFNIHLRQPLWGYRYRWDGSALVLQVRKPPAIDPANPLRGLKIAIDAGHAGGEGDTGAVGPTGYTEVEATLDVTQALAALLRERGAEVLETRPSTAIVPLIDRPIMADRENADLFISVHFNAFPDGVNPFERHGTTMFYFWPQSLDFARHLQAEVLAELGLPDRGVRYQNLAITRTPWMPSVLTETLFMMFPEQESAIQQPEVVERVAEAHLRAMEAFVREQAQATAGDAPREF